MTLSLFSHDPQVRRVILNAYAVELSFVVFPAYNQLLLCAVKDIDSPGSFHTAIWQDDVDNYLLDLICVGDRQPRCDKPLSLIGTLKRDVRQIGGARNDTGKSAA